MVKLTSRVLVGATALLLIPACGGDDDDDDDTMASKEETTCAALCANEAMLDCPNPNDNCVSGCQSVYRQVEQTYPNCIAEIDARFTCTAHVPLSSIQCNPDSASPTYADDVCADEQAALVACGSQ